MVNPSHSSEELLPSAGHFLQAFLESVDKSPTSRTLLNSDMRTRAVPLVVHPLAPLLSWPNYNFVCPSSLFHAALDFSL